MTSATTSEAVKLPSDPPETVIVPPKGWGSYSFREIWEARFILWNLIMRNIRSSYADMRWGVLWTLLRPIIFVSVVFTIKHRSNAQMAEGVNYVLFLYSGLVLWWYFVAALSAATKSVFKDSGLISKIYYPRIITPIVPVA